MKVIASLFNNCDENFTCISLNSYRFLKYPILVSKELSRRYDVFTSSVLYKSLSPSIKLALSIQNLAPFIFHVKSDSSSETSLLFYVFKYISPLLARSLEYAILIKTTFSLINTKNLKFKLTKHLNNYKQALSKENKTGFIASILKVIHSVSRIFDAPKTIAKFLDIFSIPVPTCAESILGFTNSCSFFSQPAKIISKLRECHSMIVLNRDLQKEKYIIFLESYINKINHSTVNSKIPEDIANLSIESLREAVSLAKANLKNDTSILLKLKRISNIRFVKFLYTKMENKPDIAWKIFRVKFDTKLESPDNPPLITFGNNFFEDLTAKRMQKRSKVDKLDRAVKEINSYLKFRICTHCFSVTTKSFAWTTNLIEGPLGIPWNPLSPIRLTIEGILTAVSFFSFIYQVKRKNEFLMKIETLTGKYKSRELP